MCAARFNVSLKDSYNGDWQFAEPQKRGISLNAVTNSSSNNLQRRQQQYQQPSFNQGLNYNSNKGGYQPNMIPRDYQAAEREAQQFLGKQNQWDVKDTKHSALSLLEEFEYNAKRPNQYLPSSQNPLQALQQQQQQLYQQLPSQQESYQQGQYQQQSQQQLGVPSQPGYYPQQQYNNRGVTNNAEVPILLSKLEEQNIALMNLISEVANKSDKRKNKKNKRNYNNNDSDDDDDDDDSEEDNKDYRHKKKGNNKQNHRKQQQQQQQDKGDGTQELARRVAQLEAKLVLNNGGNNNSNNQANNLNYPGNQGSQSNNILKNGMESSIPVSNDKKNEQYYEQNRNSNQNQINNYDNNNNNNKTFSQPFQQQNMSNYPIPFSVSLPLNQMNFQQLPTQQIPSNGQINPGGFNLMNQQGNIQNTSSQNSLNEDSFQSNRENQPYQRATAQQQKQLQVNNNTIQQRTNTGNTNNNFSNDLYALNQFSVFQANRNNAGQQSNNNDNKGGQTMDILNAPTVVARVRGGTGGITSTIGKKIDNYGEKEEFNKFKSNQDNNSSSNNNNNNRRTQTGAKEDVYDALERYAKSKEEDIKQERLKSQQQQQGLDGYNEKKNTNMQRKLNNIDLDESYLGVVPQRPQLIDQRNGRSSIPQLNGQEDLLESQPLPMQFKLMAKQQSNNTSLWKDAYTPDQSVLADIFRAQNLNSAARPV